MRFTLSILTAALISQFSYATSRPIPVDQMNEQQVENVFYPEYPDPVNIYKTNVLFFYTPDLLDYYEGDLQKIYDFAEQSIEVNNEHLANGGIGIVRETAAILELPFEYDDAYDGSDSRLYNFASKFWEVESDYESYQASYYVLLSRYYGQNAVGIAYRGSNIAMVSPYSNKQHALTVLTHELGHNDGLMHDVSDTTDNDVSTFLREDSVGYACGNNFSVMTYQGFSAGSNFFSNPEMYEESSGLECGELGVANSAGALREAVNSGAFVSGKYPFRDIIIPTDGEGTVSLIGSEGSAYESDGAFEVQVDWSDAPPTTSVEIHIGETEDDLNDQDAHDIASRILRVERPVDSDVSTHTFDLIDDDFYERDEHFTVTLQYPERLTIAEGSLDFTLISDEMPERGEVEMSLSLTEFKEGDTATLTLNRVGGADEELPVMLSLSGQALASDVSLEQNEVVFAHGELRKTVGITIVDDEEDEQAESFSIQVESEFMDSRPSVTGTIAKSDNKSGGSMSIALLGLGLLAGIRRITKNN